MLPPPKPLPREPGPVYLEGGGVPPELTRGGLALPGLALELPDSLLDLLRHPTDGAREPRHAEISLQNAQDGPNTAQEAAKTPQKASSEAPKKPKSSKSNRKAYMFSIYDISASTALKTVQEAPKIAPGRPKRLPRGPHDGPSGLQDGRRGAQDGPSEPPDGPKRGSRGGPRTENSGLPPQESSKRPQEPPKRPQEAPKQLPRSPKRPPRRPQEAQNRPSHPDPHGHPRGFIPAAPARWQNAPQARRYFLGLYPWLSLPFHFPTTFFSHCGLHPRPSRLAFSPSKKNQRDIQRSQYHRLPLQPFPIHPSRSSLSLLLEDGPTRYWKAEGP